MAQIVSGYRGEISFLTYVAATPTTGSQAQRVNAYIQSWQGTLVHDKFDATKFDPTTAGKEVQGGMHQLTGTATGWIDDAAMPSIAGLLVGGLIPVAGNSWMRLFGTGSKTTAFYGTCYEFVAFMDSLAITARRTGITEVVFAFTSSGVVAEQTT